MKNFGQKFLWSFAFPCLVGIFTAFATTSMQYQSRIKEIELELVAQNDLLEKATELKKREDAAKLEFVDIDIDRKYGLFSPSPYDYQYIEDFIPDESSWDGMIFIEDKPWYEFCPRNTLMHKSIPILHDLKQVKDLLKFANSHDVASFSNELERLGNNRDIDGLLVLKNMDAEDALQTVRNLDRVLSKGGANLSFPSFHIIVENVGANPTLIKNITLELVEVESLYQGGGEPQSIHNSSLGTDTNIEFTFDDITRALWDGVIAKTVTLETPIVLRGKSFSKIDIAINSNDPELFFSMGAYLFRATIEYGADTSITSKLFCVMIET